MDMTDQGFVAHWQRISPILANVERRRLRAYSEAERTKDIQALLNLQINIPPSNVSTGLIEQQRLFARQRP